MVEVKIVRRTMPATPTWDTLKVGEWFLDQNGELATKTGIAGLLYPGKPEGSRRVILSYNQQRALEIHPVDVQIVATERAA